MSNLRHGDDDHPEAAAKHYADSSFLLDHGRFDAAGYLCGYVVECSLKSVILHDRSWDPTLRRHDVGQIATWHGVLSRRPYGHDLLSIANLTVGVAGASYLPDLMQGATTGRASIFDWRETIRYRPPGFVDEPRAIAWGSWASHAFCESIVRMRLDEVL